MKKELDKTLQQSKSLLWGISIALSWTWGIGIFFSVQMAIEFGLVGLFSFAAINATGLLLFGFYTQRLAGRFSTPAHFETHFFNTVRGQRGSIFFYQLLAILLTLFAVLKYIFIPIGFMLPLVCLLILGLTFFLGEEFNIRTIKYLHAYVLLGVLVAVATLLWFVLPNAVAPWAAGAPLEKLNFVFNLQGERPLAGDNLSYFLYLLIPIGVGFFLGPWLDLQQWQRAIQIHREGLSIVGSYVCGAIIFFAILVFHGFFALVIYNLNGGAEFLVTPSIDGLFHAKDSVMNFFLLPNNPHVAFVGFYIGFICLLALTTFDSGYIALRWFLQDSIKRSNNTLLALVPTKFLTSPLLYYFPIAVLALVGAYLQLEVEYFMAFYASFLVGYIVIFIRRVMLNRGEVKVPLMKLFSASVFSIALFGLGYFGQLGELMAIASVTPLFYGIWLTSLARPAAGTAEARFGKREQPAPEEEPGMEPEPEEGPGAAPVTGEVEESKVPATATATGMPSTYLDGKWFVHQFVATYADTNSVGNVYFGMYAMWVGKTRELFFRHAMPSFDLKTTDYFILTRQFEHKFVRESREFETIKVRIRVASHNRRFCTLEHQVLNGEDRLLGKGSQTLLFVSSKDYRIRDIPQEAYTAFIQYV